MAAKLEIIKVAFDKIMAEGISTATITDLFKAIAEVILNLVKEEI